MSKGSSRRPCFVSDEELEERWEEAFGKKIRQQFITITGNWDRGRRVKFVPEGADPGEGWEKMEDCHWGEP